MVVVERWCYFQLASTDAGLSQRNNKEKRWKWRQWWQYGLRHPITVAGVELFKLILQKLQPREPRIVLPGDGCAIFLLFMLQVMTFFIALFSVCSFYQCISSSFSLLILLVCFYIFFINSFSSFLTFSSFIRSVCFLLFINVLITHFLHYLSF